MSDYLIVQRQGNYYIAACICTPLQPPRFEQPPETLRGKEALTFFLQDVLQLSHELIEQVVQCEQAFLLLSSEQVNRWRFWRVVENVYALPIQT